MLDRTELKREAREINRSARVSVYGFALLYLGICLILRGIDGYVSDTFVIYMQRYYPDMPVPSFLLHGEFSTTTVMFVGVLVTLLCAVLDMGWRLYLLGIRRGQEMGYATLFDGFTFAGKVIMLHLLMYALIMLWSMLLVIPGIVAIYRYRFAPYNLCENPEIGVLEALRMSMVQTYGFKLELFIRDLTFLGWLLLCVAALYIPMIWVAPYYWQTDIGYFQRIKDIKGVGYRPSPDGWETPPDDSDHTLY